MRLPHHVLNSSTMESLWDETNLIISVSVVAGTSDNRWCLRLIALTSFNDVLFVKEVVGRPHSVHFSMCSFPHEVRLTRTGAESSRQSDPFAPCRPRLQRASCHRWCSGHFEGRCRALWPCRKCSAKKQCWRHARGDGFGQVYWQLPLRLHGESELEVSSIRHQTSWLFTGWVYDCLMILNSSVHSGRYQLNVESLHGGITVSIWSQTKANGCSSIDDISTYMRIDIYVIR